MTERLSPERWHAASPELDRALELASEERAGWLAELRARDPALAADVEALLEEHRALEHEDFLADGPAHPPPDAGLAGRAIGAYTLRSRLGEGGMGTVWLAERSDGRFEGVAAVKLLGTGLVGRGAQARFAREGRILARLRHPHIAQLIDAGVSPWGQPYLVLERVDGERIDHYCDAASLSVEARVRLFLDVLAAVSHAHASLIVHRDLKPSNVLVDVRGQVKLLDFGIAKLLDPDGVGGEVTALTREGESAMTPEYAAPEQLTGGDVTTATDVYALGVLLYIILAGRHPVPGASCRAPAELVKAIVDTEPLRVSEAAGAAAAEGEVGIAARRATSPKRLRSALGGDLDNIVAKALKKRPHERYASVDAMADDLRRYLRHETVGARPDTFTYQVARFVRRNRAAAALATLALLLLAGGLLGTASQARRARAQAARADEEARAAGEQRDFALRQLSRAEAINDLNAFLLFDAAPVGQPFTVGDLLERAERIVEQQTDDPDDNRVELLVGIGHQYDLQDEADKARRVLEKAYALARTSTDPASRAKAACALSSTVGAAGEHERAEQLVQEGLSALPSQPPFALHRIFCLLRGSRVAGQGGRGQEAVERATEARRLARESRFASVLFGHRASMELASAYGTAGRHREAAEAFEEGYRQLSALGRGDTQSAATLLNNWALALRLLGQPLQAERLFRHAIQISSAGGTDESVSPMVLNNLARALGDLERLPEASEHARRAYEKALRTGHGAALTHSLFSRAAFFRQQGDLRRAAEALAELEPRMKRMYRDGHGAWAVLALEQAECARARGDLAAAAAAADRAVTLSESAGSYGAAFLPIALLRRSELALALRAADRAAADAARALEIRRGTTSAGTFSSHLGLAQLAWGRALAAQGRTAEARAAFREAVAQLGPTVGAEHPAARSARELAATLTPPPGR